MNKQHKKSIQTQSHGITKCILPVVVDGGAVVVDGGAVVVDGGAVVVDGGAVVVDGGAIED